MYRNEFHLIYLFISFVPIYACGCTLVCSGKRNKIELCIRSPVCLRASAVFTARNEITLHLSW